MAFCANCGSEMSEQAPACPRCGHPRGVLSTRRTEGTAVASLILGVLGVVSCPLILSIPAVILGSQAQSKIRADPGLEGEGLARAGVVLGWIGIGLAALGVLIFVLALLSGTSGVGPDFFQDAMAA